MSLPPIKKEILETMLLEDEPQKAADIAKEAHKEFQPVMMHILGLVRMGYVSSPSKGLYIITAQGKKALGIPEITKDKATQILAYAPHDKAFNFYKSMDNPLGIHAHNLRDFTVKIDKVDTASLEFHVKRGDFEAWFKCLGDEELVKKMALLKQRNLTGEHLREHLHEAVDKHFHELAVLAGEVFPEDEAEHTHTHHDHNHDHEHASHTHT
jgi:hypothetical protein